MAKKIALGKGIASLLNETPNTLLKASLSEGEVNNSQKETSFESGPMLVDVSQIKANPNQPRKIFKEKELQELSLSIKENGIIQALVVSKTDNGFELIAGERRLRAAKMVELDKVPVIVKRCTEKDRVVMAIIENIQRSDLNCVEEALAYYQLSSDYSLTQEEVAKRLGKDRSTVANFLRILKLPREVVELLQKEELSFGHGKVLAVEKDRQRVIRLAKQAITENLSVRELEKLIKTKPKIEKGQSSQEKFFDKKLDQLRETLEKKTGYHFMINSKKNGAGQISLKYSNEAEFNDIYEFLLNR